MPHPSALNQGGHKWRTISPDQYDAWFIAIQKLRHSRADLEEARFPFKDHVYTPHPTKQDWHLKIVEHCRNCGVSKKAFLQGTAVEKRCLVHLSPNPPNSGKCPHCKRSLKLTGCHLNSHIPDQHTFVAGSFDSANRTYFEAPASNPNARRIVVLDCEMLELAYGQETVCQLSAVDFLTGEILIDSLVAPPSDIRVSDWRTKYTSLNADIMRSAIKQGKTLNGIAGARAELFKYIDANTILIGFSVHHDFEALRLTHSNVVDFQILYSKAFHGKVVGLAKAIRSYFPSMRIQNHGSGGDGHVCLEDVMAARELVLFWVLKKGNVEILSFAEMLDKLDDLRIERIERSMGLY
ncbi:hypothetical protein BJ508DRAFT_24407 [Ascobolus immersus RN42]|uniref:Exonuclease domain-containing protein n=1 Tax=Ascobolus immersus RN42 TaxID=1160509 RepID=A0A3N4HQ80_ASCIM|nr:hypothetical protein BJ508DRAFT_24407 [Ascobolus immersus RN42]